MPNFVGYEYGQKQSVKLPQKLVSNITTAPHHTLSVYPVYNVLDFGGGGGVGEVNQR
jgi:hypothetical protein